MEGVLGKNHQNQPVRQVGNVGHLLIDEDSGSPHPADQPFCAEQFQGAVDCPVADLEMFRQFELRGQIPVRELTVKDAIP